MVADFCGSPVTKGVLASTLIASAFLHARDPNGDLNVTLDIWRVLTKGEVWRLVSCHTLCTSMGPLAATSLCLYRLRLLEPLLGSKKFGTFVAVASGLAIPFEAVAGVYFGTVRLTPGPIPLVFAMMVVYYAIVPPSKTRRFSAFGIGVSKKAFNFCVAGMLACCEGWNSIVPAVCGALVGGLYLTDTVSIQSLRLSSIVYRCFSLLRCPFRWSSRRGSFFPGGGSRGISSATPSSRNMNRPRSIQPRTNVGTAGREGGEGRDGRGSGNGGGGGTGGGGLLRYFTQPRQGAGTTRLRSSSPPLPLPSEDSISALTGMGFDRASVLQALQHTGNDSFAAANILVFRAGSGSGTGVAATAGGRGGEVPISGAGGQEVTSRLPLGNGSSATSATPHQHFS